MTSDDSRPTPDAAQGGQNYLASVSDLVSALIFVFIIMLAIFAYQLARVTSDLASANETRDQIREKTTKISGTLPAGWRSRA